MAIVHAGFDHSRWVYFWMFPDSAVDLFFCLSGFSLCLAYKAGSGGGLEFWPYMRARFARIYPLYAVSLGLMWWLVFRHLGGSGYYPTPLYVADAVRQVFMVNTWPLIGSGSNWDFPAWSLSVEAFCYIGIFPLLFKSLPRLMAWSVSRRLCLLVVLGFVSVIAFVRLWDGFMVSVHLYHPHPISLWIPMLRGVTLFTAGGIIYSFWVRKDAVASLAGQACDAVALAGFGILVGAVFMTLHKDYLTLLAPALVLGLAVNEKAVVARLLAAQPFYWLGEISYSLYLLHVPVDYELHHAWPALNRWPLPDFLSRWQQCWPHPRFLTTASNLRCGPGSRAGSGCCGRCQRRHDYGAGAWAPLGTPLMVGVAVPVRGRPGICGCVVGPPAVPGIIVLLPAPTVIEAPGD